MTMTKNMTKPMTKILTKPVIKTMITNDHNQKGSSKLRLYVYEFDEDNCVENLEKQLAILIFYLIDGHWTTCAENHQPAPSGGHW